MTAVWAVLGYLFTIGLSVGYFVYIKDTSEIEKSDDQPFDLQTDEVAEINESD